jgi:hypothetical protein
MAPKEQPMIDDRRHPEFVASCVAQGAVEIPVDPVTGYRVATGAQEKFRDRLQTENTADRLRARARAELARRNGS